MRGRATDTASPVTGACALSSVVCVAARANVGKAFTPYSGAPLPLLQVPLLASHDVSVPVHPIEHGSCIVVNVGVAPVDPVRVVIRGADVHVLHKWYDRDINVAGDCHSILELREKFFGCGLQGGHLAAVGHRTGIVEHERDAQPRDTPLGGGVGLHREGVKAENLHELGRQLRRRTEEDLGIVARIERHIDVDVASHRAWRRSPGEDRTAWRNI